MSINLSRAWTETKDYDVRDMRNMLEKRILLLDGGLGTTLEDEHGVIFSDDTPLWSSHLLISKPDLILRVQQNFSRAGADIILTPTYQISDEGFRRTGISDTNKYYAAAVQISKTTNKLVALSLGAYGAVLSPSQEYNGDYGNVDENDLRQFHTARLAQFAPYWSDIDLVAYETIPRLDEVRAIKATNPPKPYWISCVFPKTDRLPDETSIEELFRELLAEPQPWAIGLNCTKVHMVADIVKKFEQAADILRLELPGLVVYPDGTNGTVYDTTTRKWRGQDRDDVGWDEQVAGIVEDIQDRGRWARLVVGGCCKTSPHHIAALRRRLDDMEKKKVSR